MAEEPGAVLSEKVEKQRLGISASDLLGGFGDGFLNRHRLKNSWQAGSRLRLSLLQMQGSLHCADDETVLSGRDDKSRDTVIS